MSHSLRLPSRPAARSGFTLVELLVVIAIIALLAGVAMGPITGALKTAKDNAGMQTTHALYLADFQYSIDNSTSQGSFADAADAGGIAQALINGGYITDPSIFYLSGSSATKFSGANAATSIQASNVSWDFYGVNGTGGGGGSAGSTSSSFNGISTSDPDQLPLIWATGNKVNLPTSPGEYGTAIVNGNGKNPFGTDGIAVAYKSGSSSFRKVTQLSSLTISNFVDNSYTPPTNTTYVVRTGSN
jgi:prepilin-type N-terminal cleavage/methylation domain-containing protein